MCNSDFLINQFDKNYNECIVHFKELSNHSVLKDFTKWLFDKLRYDDFILMYNESFIYNKSDVSVFINLFRSLIHAITDDGEITLCKIHVHQPKILDGYEEDLTFSKIRKLDSVNKRLVDADPDVIFYNSLNDFMKATDEWQKNFLKYAIYGDCVKRKQNNVSIKHYEKYQYFAEVVESDEYLKKLYLESK